MNFQKDRLLAPFTSIGLGGPASFYAEVTNQKDILESLEFAGSKGLPVFVLGGGSNIIFPDSGYPGLVIHMLNSGVSLLEENAEWFRVRAESGQDWSEFVLSCVKNNWAGVECLSGIPGKVGGVPVQNVGAYGQEARETIESLDCMDRSTGKVTTFSNSECDFGYRSSRFKFKDRGRFIVLSVTFLLRKNAQEARYPELQNLLKTEPYSGLAPLLRLSSAVIALRKTKSMVLSGADPESKSVGSFFTNPIVNSDTLEKVKSIVRARNLPEPNIFPVEIENNFKVPAAYLIEQSGFSKGQSLNGVGISKNHALALVNRGGTTKALMDFAGEVIKRVQETFGIELRMEPEYIDPTVYK